MAGRGTPKKHAVVLEDRLDAVILPTITVVSRDPNAV